MDVCFCNLFAFSPQDIRHEITFVDTTTTNQPFLRKRTCLFGALIKVCLSAFYHNNLAQISRFQAAKTRSNYRNVCKPYYLIQILRRCTRMSAQQSCKCYDLILRTTNCKSMQLSFPKAQRKLQILVSVLLLSTSPYHSVDSNIKLLTTGFEKKKSEHINNQWRSCASFPSVNKYMDEKIQPLEVLIRADMIVE